MPIEGNRNHPLRQRIRRDALTFEIDPDYVEYGQPAPLRFHTLSEGLDEIALAVAHLPSSPSPSQKKRLRIIARELARRARS